MYVKTITPGVHTVTVITPSGKSNSADFTIASSSADTGTTTPSCNLTRSLSFGSTGTDVKCLQTLLAQDAQIYPEGLVTGYFGSLTKQAVIRFQAAHSIAQVGVVGPITRLALSSLRTAQ
jgi:peptidoglycan hydrolase-like protein with peptidoglycan-binding domain